MTDRGPREGSGVPDPRREAAGRPPHVTILAGLVIGAAGGILANALWSDAPQLRWTVDNIAHPVGQVFLRMLFMIVVPLVVTSLALGVAGLGDFRRLGRIGIKTLGFFLATTALAVTIGLIAVNGIRPGDALEPAMRASLMQEYADRAAETVEAAEQTGFGVKTFVSVIPRNPVRAAADGDMLAVIFFTLVFAVALTRLSQEVAAPVLRVLEAIGQAVMVMIGFAMKVAPIGVAGLVFAVTARFGFGVLESLGLYIVTVLGGLALHQFVVIPSLARILAGVRPGDFFRRSRAVIVTAFSTSSSNATLPTTMRTAEVDFGVPREIAGFVLPLGATMNMNGTALFEGITVLFLAQVFGVHLSLSMQLLVLVMTIITAVGAAGVPSGSIPLLVMVLMMVGIPGEAIGLILGVDRLLDMARTVPNVTGDLLTSLVVARSERLAIAATPQPGPPPTPTTASTPAKKS